MWNKGIKIIGVGQVEEVGFFTWQFMSEKLGIVDQGFLEKGKVLVGNELQKRLRNGNWNKVISKYRKRLTDCEYALPSTGRCLELLMSD